MDTFAVEVEKGTIKVDTNFLAKYFGRNKSTIRSWKNNKEMPVLSIDDKGIVFYDLQETIKWHKLNIKEKFNKNKNKEIDVESDDEEFDFKLPYDLQLADIDLENSLHLSILAAHPMGELIRDTLQFVKDQQKREAEIQSKEHDLQVKKGQYLRIEELNARMSEFIALVKDVDINARAKFPDEISNKLMAEGLIDKEGKEKTQELILKSVDEVQKQKYKIISSQFMKHIKDKTKKITVELLENMIEYIKKEKEE